MAGGAPHEVGNRSPEDAAARKVIQAFVALRLSVDDAKGLMAYAEARDAAPSSPPPPKSHLAESLVERSRESGIPVGVLLALAELFAEADAAAGEGTPIDDRQLAAAAERLTPGVAGQGLEALERVQEIATAADPDYARAPTAALAAQPVVRRMRRAFTGIHPSVAPVRVSPPSLSSLALGSRLVRPRSRARRDRRRACRGPSRSDDGPGEQGDDPEPPSCSGRRR